MLYDQNRVVFKFTRQLHKAIAEPFGWTIPTDQPPLHVDVYSNDYRNELEVRAWFDVNRTNKRTRRTFIVVGTGKDVPLRATHCGTAISGRFVWHLFELPKDGD